jgi:hypothetical protein
MKIGYIDYYLNEFHANRYIGWLKEEDPTMEVAYAYGQIASPINKMTSEEWCKTYGVTQCGTIEEVVKKSDVLIVLAPDNCETHEALCQLPLASGKPCYVDKTFAPDLYTAKRMFALADKHNTPCYSTSALRYSHEYKGVDPATVKAIATWGPNPFDNYSIHQLEPIVMLMNCDCDTVLYIEGDNTYTIHMIFKDGRPAVMTSFLGGSPFISNIPPQKRTRCTLLPARIGSRSSRNW